MTRSALEFELPPALEASEPAEVRGRGRDDVRLMVGWRSSTRIEHHQFTELPSLLAAGDLLVVNTSGTMAAALDAETSDGTPYELHLSTPLPGGLWVVEVRRPGPNGTEPHFGMDTGSWLLLPESASVELLAPYPLGAYRPGIGSRLWVAALHGTGDDLTAWLAVHGRPIRYGYVSQPWPLSAYQTVFAVEPGSVEMPSAGRAFTPELVTAAVSRGVAIAPIRLHAGVSSQEAHEPPFAEPFRVPAATARLVNLTRQAGGRVVAVGTTVVRALETVVDDRGEVHPGEGWTELVVTPERGVRVVDGLLTGWHEPKASHLLLLDAVAGRDLLDVSYRAALENGYLWHEFGDLHLILP
ncbi:MAG: S-adenosylmethionine:tRNA ribosyltransferase-isomerase [Actinomycetota bacterium]|jgi:S-adenosylmethionine:tRNA ribosyltransferase-isomerase|nr:S-adenosylmethionine:tRNA ribosyltransferase-isomerase [Actinomycetota bacterium]